MFKWALLHILHQIRNLLDSSRQENSIKRAAYKQVPFRNLKDAARSTLHSGLLFTFRIRTTSHTPPVIKKHAKLFHWCVDVIWLDPVCITNQCDVDYRWGMQKIKGTSKVPKSESLQSRNMDLFFQAYLSKFPRAVNFWRIRITYENNSTTIKPKAGIYLWRMDQTLQIWSF